MDHLLAVDVLLGDQAALSTVLSTNNSSTAYTQLANNVFYLAGRVVDKLWQGKTTFVCFCLACQLYVSFVWDFHSCWRETWLTCQLDISLVNFSNWGLCQLSVVH